MTRFLSKRFFLALGAAVTAAASGQWGAFVSVVLGYLGAESYRPTTSPVVPKDGECDAV